MSVGQRSKIVGVCKFCSGEKGVCRAGVPKILQFFAFVGLKIQFQARFCEIFKYFGKSSLKFANFSRFFRNFEGVCEIFWQKSRGL